MSEHEPEASAAQQEAVRRLLAQARHDEPVPPAVRARLDGVLAGLASEGPRAVDPPPPPPLAPVVDLAARRRRRVVGMLGAAAAVVVLGVGIGTVIDTTGDGDDDATSADDVGGAAETEFSRAPDGAAPNQENAPGAPEPPLPSDVPPPDTEQGPLVPPISAATFPEAAERLRDVPGVLSSEGLVISGDDLTTSSMFECPPTAWGAGRLVAVRFEGLPAVLAYRPAVGDTQSVELLQCGSGDVLRSTVLPFP